MRLRAAGEGFRQVAWWGAVAPVYFAAGFFLGAPTCARERREGKARAGGPPWNSEKSFSAGVGSSRGREAQLPKAQQLDGAACRMGAAMQVPQPIEPLHDQSQAGEQPDDEQAVRFVMADVLEAVAVLGVIEPLILNVPAALGEAEQFAAADLASREIGKPERLDDFAARLMLTVTHDAHGLPVERLPRVEIVGVPNFNAVLALGKDLVWRLVPESLPGGGEQFGEIALEADHDVESQIVRLLEERGAGIFAIGHHVVGKAWPEAFDSAPQQATAGAELAIAGAVGFDIERQHQAGSDHADHRQLMVITDNLLPRVMVRAAQITSLFA